MNKEGRTEQVKIRFGKRYKQRLIEMANARGISVSAMCLEIITEYLDNEFVMMEREMDRLASALVATEARYMIRNKRGYRERVVEKAREAMK